MITDRELVALMADTVIRFRSHMEAVDVDALSLTDLFQLYKTLRRNNASNVFPGTNLAVRARLAALDVDTLTGPEAARLGKKLRPGTLAARDFPDLARALSDRITRDAERAMAEALAQITGEPCDLSGWDTGPAFPDLTV